MISFSDSLVHYTDTAVHRSRQAKARYYAVTVSDGYLESNHTDTVTVPLPWNLLVTPPKEVDYTIDPSGFIRLFWTFPAENSGVAGFNVYRSYKESSVTKLNASLLPADMNSFVDKNPGAYGTFQYSVEAVSVGGKSSAMRTTVSVDRPRMSFHLVISSGQEENKVVLTWLDPDIPDLDVLYFYRKTGTEEVRLKKMVKPIVQTWTDEEIVPGNTYLYTVIAEFKDGARILVNDGIQVVTR